LDVVSRELLQDVEKIIADKATTQSVMVFIRSSFYLRFELLLFDPEFMLPLLRFELPLLLEFELLLLLEFELLLLLFELLFVRVFDMLEFASGFTFGRRFE